MLLSCKETTLLLSKGEDRKLAFGERVALRLHLAICDGCRTLKAHFKILGTAVKNLSRNDAEGKDN
jgi:hypothetical protein